MNLADELRGVKPPRPEKARRVLVVLCGLLADEAEIRKAQVRQKNLAYRKGLGADPKRKKDREGEPEITTPLGPPPANLNEAEQKRWNEIATWCSWATIADRILVEQTSKLWQLSRDNKATIAQEKLLASNLIRLGMTPADRSKVKVPGDKPKAKNAFGALSG